MGLGCGKSIGASMQIDTPNLAVHSYIACIQAFVQQKADVALFEKHFLDDLAVLSDDLLDVRIMVAKCLGPICARGKCGGLSDLEYTDPNPPHVHVEQTDCTRTRHFVLFD